MMKMLIELNDELIENDGYSIEKMWAEIDAVFANADCTKNIIDNKTVIYEGNSNKPSHTGDMYIISSGIYDLSWFETYANKMTVYENEDDDTLPLEETDGLAIIKKYRNIK